MRLVYRSLSVCGLAIPTSLTEAEAERLQELARDKAVLEVGSAYGFSTIVMASVAKHVTAVDPHMDEVPGSLRVIHDNLQMSGMAGRVTMVRRLSQGYLPEIHRYGARFDLVFIDGDHRYDYVVSDLMNAWKVLEPGGVLAVHDYGEESCPDVALAVDDYFTPDLPRDLTDTLCVLPKPHAGEGALVA